MPDSTAPDRLDVSIVIPVYDKLDFTKACVASIHAEPCHASWEIVVVDNGSTDGTVEWLAAEEAAGRLRVVSPGQNLGFAAGCNAGAEAATGRHLVFLNNDTEVTAGWLDPLVTTLDRDPQVHAVGARLLYPDRTIQHAGVVLVESRRNLGTPLGGVHVHEKKPWNDPAVRHPQRMQAVTAALMAVRPEVFARLGGFDTAYWNGNEDVDFCLRLGETGGLVVYRPECVVFHHESQSGPERWAQTRRNIEIFTERWQDRARPDYIGETDGQTYDAGAGRIGMYASPSIAWDRPFGPETASVVVLTWNAPDYVRRCAESLVRHTDPRHEILFVDNGSDRETLDILAEFESAHDQVRVIRNGRNLGYPAGNNVGIAAARGEHVCLLNSDTVVTDGWLERLLAKFADGDVGLVGAVTNSIAGVQKLPAVDYDQRTLEGLDDFAGRRVAAETGNTTPAFLLTGFCLLLHRGLLARIGGLDERFGQGNYEDTDYCLRAFLAGWRAVAAQDCFVHHFGSRSFAAGNVDYMKQIAARWEIFRRKWNLPPEARETGDLELERLVVEGFSPLLHTEPLPPADGAVRLPLSDWEIESGLERGEGLFAAGRLAEAEQVFRSVLREDPASDRAAGDLACTLWQDDPAVNLPEAVSLLEGVLERDPDNEDARWNLQEMQGVAVAD
ncbi:MAG: glycosyltransferase [bacterium]|nr:glycosyltransferase [bacterium]